MMGRGAFNKEVQRARESMLGLWPASKNEDIKKKKEEKNSEKQADSREPQGAIENLKKAYGDSTKGKKFWDWKVL